MAETIEDIAKTAPQPPQQEKKEEQRPVGTLGSVVNETRDFFRKTFDIGLGLGASVATTGFIGVQEGASSVSDIVRKGSDGIVVPVAYAAGEKFVQGRNFSTAHFRDQMVSGGIQTAGIIYPAYKYMNIAQQGIVNAVNATQYAQYADIAGVVGRSILNVPIYFPLAILGYYIVDHLVTKRTFKGLYRDTIKPNFKKDLKNAYIWLGLPVLVNALLVPAALQVTGAAILTFAYKVLMSYKQKSKAQQPKDTQSYFSAASNALGRGLNNLFWAPLNLAYATGTAMRNLYDKIPAAPPQLAPTPSAPALQPAPA